MPGFGRDSGVGSGSPPSDGPLLLTDLIASGSAPLARLMSIVTLQGIKLGHSGFFTVPSPTPGGPDSNIFAFYQPCTSCGDPSKAPLIQWFNGGPGSPDTVGLFNQIGRFYVDDKMVLRARCHTLCATSSCLFLDSPVGTGYSYQEGEEFIPTSTSRDVARQAGEVLRQGLMARSRERSRGGDCKGAFEEWNRVFNDDGGTSCEPDCEFLFREWTGSGNTEHALLLGQPAEFDFFRKFLKTEGVEEALHVAGSPASGDSDATMSEGGLVYAAMVES
ncbi:hypothetical protein TrRE_jg12656, partial [Triparma retinervis]